MNVLVIPGYYSDGQDPTKGIFIREQIQACKDIHQIRVLFPQTFISGQEEFHFIKQNEDNVVTYRTYLKILGNPAKSNHYYTLNAVLSYELILKDGFKPHIIHAHLSYPSGIAAQILSRRFKIPYIITEHSRPGLIMRTPLRKALIPEAVKQASCVIAISNLLKEELVSANLAGNYKVLPNVVNHDVFYPGEKKVNYNNSINAVIVANMRTDHIKGLKYLFEALSLIKDKLNNFKLYIIGDGETKDYYAEMSKRLGVFGFCEFHGYKKKTEIADLMRESDFFIMSSDYETGGCVLLEAMACGLPVISTRVGYARDEVNEQLGIVVDPKDSGSLAQGILQMLTTFHLYNRDEIRKASEKYSYNAYCREMDKIYRQVVMERGTS